MQNKSPPLILTFGASDPVGATGIQADLASFAAIGCHGLSALTAVLVGDTSEIDDIHPLDADLVDEQARTVLEDMLISAIKIGQVGSAENVTAIAEIVSDYPEMPIVLAPFNAAIPAADSEADDIVAAISELLIPQASLLVISSSELHRLADTWKNPDLPESSIDIATEVAVLLDSGCEYVLVTDISLSTNEVANILFNDTGVVQQHQWPRIPGVFMGAGNTLAAAITAVLANGLEMPEAVLEAQEYTFAAVSNAHAPGMGKLVLNHYFWTEESE
ncbi:hydroxymethylpyrimidine/phosphomethylpyrimidine kinase [soil metagenome]